MIYIEKAKDENRKNEYVLHVNLQEALLLRSMLINQKYEYETIYEKDSRLEDFQNLKQIQQLVNLDRTEIKFRIKKLNNL